MRCQTQDPMIGEVKRILQLGGLIGAFEVPADAGAAEVEALFLAELRSRRQRWAQRVRLTHADMREGRQCSRRESRAALAS